MRLRDREMNEMKKAKHFSWLAYIGATLAACGGSSALFDGSEQWETLIKVLVIVGIGLIALWTLIFIFEILSTLKPAFKKILNLVLFIPKLISRLYITLIKILIR